MYRLIATCLVGTVAAAALAGTTASAQEAGAVRGTVTLEENGEPVHGAVILVVGSGAFALTDEQGMFEIDNIPAGSYEVLAQREHLTAGRQSVIVDPGETAMVDFMLGLSPVHEDVTVTASVGGTETTFEAFNAVTTMDSFDITRESAGSLGDALRNEPGIASRSFGPGSSRPIIRGFDGDRVLILDDGLRTGDLSSQSGDHGVTIDPNGAERIEIVRGPATLLYGSNAVGGLVNIITPHESYR
ncbi:MAG: TonB-dependent receptor, partial [Acidobacteria bacterium]|nr:TonB-dependent receptor [Acidobacteriota bacterium]